jgi:hypothetical protein
MSRITKSPHAEHYKEGKIIVYAHMEQTARCGSETTSVGIKRVET